MEQLRSLRPVAIVAVHWLADGQSAVGQDSSAWVIGQIGERLDNNFASILWASHSTAVMPEILILSRSRPLAARCF